MTLVKPFLSSEPCISNIDCLSQKTILVCTESPQTGERMCVKPSKKTKCKEVCADGEFCGRDNMCRNGKSNFRSFLFIDFCVLVTCGSNSDCADIPEKSNCKQGKNGESTCQSPSKCSCLDDEYCTMEDTCRKPGIQIYKSAKNEEEQNFSHL